jgi:hypothetical protein
MAKKIETKPIGVQSTFNNEVGLPGGLNIIELPHVAFSVIYNGKKKYSVVKIKFDALTNNVGVATIIANNLDLYEAQYEFKKATIDAGLFEVGLDK